MKNSVNLIVKKEIKKWCKSQNIKLISEPCHLYSRAYIIEKVEILNNPYLIVSFPVIDSEPQILENSKKFEKFSNKVKIYKFDLSLQTGDWCSVAYVCMESEQINVAIPVVKID